MNYEMLLIFISSKSSLASLIKKITNSEWNHVAVNIGRILGKYNVISEASWQGIITNNLEVYEKEKDCKIHILKFPLQPSKIEFGVAEAVEARVRGIKYGFGQFVGMAPVNMLEKLNIKITNPFKHGRICSEHGLVCLAKSYYAPFKEIIEKKLKDSIDPGDLYRLSLKDPQVKIVGKKEFGQTKITWEI
jgi:hypothetical protein